MTHDNEEPSAASAGSKPLTFGSLFAGIGGFDLGLERAGMVCKWQVEIDDYATRVLEKHWPTVRRWNDVRTFPPEGDWNVDVICGGFPCQDISVAGKGAGLAGARSGLWYEFARIIRAVRPGWVVIENVPALTARGLGTVLGDLAEIGFDAEWHCIPASAVGAPHRRERIWIVAHAIGSRAWDFAGSPGRSGRRDAGRRVSALRQAHGAAGADRADSAGAAACSVADSISERDAVRGNGTPCEKGVAGRDCNAGRGECDCGAGRAGEAREGACDVSDAYGMRPSHGWTHERMGRKQRQKEAEANGRHWLSDAARDQWEAEPDVGRVAHGVPSRVDRLRGLGNAVVPQVVEVIGRAIVARG
jgi:DNA (cytosine-5)-methyltransferase 1